MGFDDANPETTDQTTRLEDRLVLANNAVTTRRVDADGQPGGSLVSAELLAYDAAGNLIQENSAETGVRDYTYDAWNRVVEVRDGNGQPIAKYRYDALGRRVNKKVYNSGSLDTVDAGDFFYYDGHRIIEHHKTVEVADEEDDDDPIVCVDGVCAVKSREGLISEAEVSAQYYPVKSGMSDVGSAPRTDSDEGASSLQGWGTDDAAAGDVTRSTDALYEKLKSAMLARGYSAPNKDSLTTYAAAVPDDPPPSTHLEFHLEREFVYGLNYIDQHVAQYDRNGYRQYILQDANYNVVGHTNASGSLIQQYAYTPYGEILASESATGTPGYAPSTSTLFQGLWYDQETGLYWIRHRPYSPPLGGYLSRDPNGQGLALGTSLRMNGEASIPVTSLRPFDQYANGASPFQFVGSNPLKYHDPNGMQALLLERGLTAGMAASLATLGAVATHGLIEQLAQLTANIAGYQAASTLATLDIDTGLELGAATSSVVAAMAYLEVAARKTALSAATVATTVVSTGVLPSFDLAVYSMSQAEAVAKAKGLAKRITEHGSRVSSGDPGDWGTGPEHWKKEIVNWLSQVARRLPRMGNKTRPPWEDWIERMLRWLENPKGPPPAAPT